MELYVSSKMMPSLDKIVFLMLDFLTTANISRRLRPPQSPDIGHLEPPDPNAHDVAVQDDSASESPDAAPLMNPLSTGPSTFMLSDTGRTCMAPLHHSRCAYKC
jgi:hypothetical protein